MFLALTVDGIRDEYKEQQVIKANIVKNKKLLLDSYKKIVSEIKGDTINLSVSRNFSKEMTIKIDSFLNGKMSENDFKSCFGCIEWVIIDLGSPINLEEYKIISSLPLFQLNSTMLDHFEKNKENDNLIWLIGQANMNIRLFYNIVESKIRVSMNEINKDVFNNIEYFKRNSQQFPAMYFPRGYKENFNVQDNVFLNMLLVRRAYVREWDSNISQMF